MSVEIGTYKLKPFECPNCKHDLMIGRIKRVPGEDGMHEVDWIDDVTGLPVATQYQPQKDST